MIAAFSSDSNFELIYNSLNNRFGIDLLISERAKKKGRGLKLSANEAEAIAVKNKIGAWHPDGFDASKLETVISNKKIKLGIIYSFGKIIPERIIKLFSLGIINIHPSLLPKYRGPTPIQTAILNADKETGYSIILADSGCDTGPILAQKIIPIAETDDYFSLKKKIDETIKKDLAEIIEKYISGGLTLIAQNKSQTTYSKKIKKTDAFISEKDSAKTADLKIRAYSKWPRAYFLIEGKKIIIHKAKKENEQLKLGIIQPEGKNNISFEEFRRGYPSLLTKFPPYVKIL